MDSSLHAMSAVGTSATLPISLAMSAFSLIPDWTQRLECEPRPTEEPPPNGIEPQRRQEGRVTLDEIHLVRDRDEGTWLSANGISRRIQGWSSAKHKPAESSPRHATRADIASPVPISSET
jgi:hypothetical protein